MNVEVVLLLTDTAVAGLIAPLTAPVATEGVIDHVVIPTEHAAADVLVPVALPLQPHVHGPVPETAVAVPVLHRLAVGALNTGVELLAVPQRPLIGVSANEATTLQLAVTGPVM